MTLEPPVTTSAVAVDLTAVVIAVSEDTPVVLVRRPEAGGRAALPAGPLQAEHGTLQAGLRSWVERQTDLGLGYVEQLYTFGDRSRPADDPARGDGGRRLSIAYLALVPPLDTAVGRAPDPRTAWMPWYDAFPWEDLRSDPEPWRARLRSALAAWGSAAPKGLKAARTERVRLTFGDESSDWDAERALERYELLYEAGLVPEAAWDAGQTPATEVLDGAGRPLAIDHRRILATAVSRLRGKIKYRPVLFELLPETFTLLRLQRTAEAISGVALHKPNFRRLVAQQGLVEDTGQMEAETGGRPAKLVRFRRDVISERPAPGVRATATRRGSYP
ncbi:hypothetical protein F1188_20120 [Roseospira marina]|uniref:NrtR DNA-binding winged helix domain-containing protein n=2 Tax=Roseospira marina TaxID=140057 RepID=A0A5M6I5A9_9PROT|nr:hypothetical protein [Roseospira marina]KAA5603017.1 hypothetical protein F1188_20120 [Roseospira marina]MBB5087805.1 hypothetical protein [Roseospira marina]